MKGVLGLHRFCSVRKGESGEDVDVFLLKVLAELLTNAEVRPKTEAALREEGKQAEVSCGTKPLLSRISIYWPKRKQKRKSCGSLPNRQASNNAVPHPWPNTIEDKRTRARLFFPLIRTAEEIGYPSDILFFIFAFPVDLSLKQIMISQGNSPDALFRGNSAGEP